MSRNPALLRVCGSGHGGEGLAEGFDERRIVLEFDPALDPFVVGDRRIDGARLLAVHPRWRAFGADFQQQLANRYFTDELLVQRPAAVLIDTVNGATMDMVRIGALLGYPVLMRVPVLPLPAPDSRAFAWLTDAVKLAAAVVACGDAEADAAFSAAFPEHALAADEAQALATLSLSKGGAARYFGYAHYAFGLRDHGLLYRMQQPLAGHFDGCREVLEVACGPAVFLDILRTRGIAAFGVERDPAAVRYARGLGFDVVEDDALAHLAGQTGRFDGIYCSHFVEHLDTAGVERLIGLIAGALRPGGVAVFVFPDPESIRSQLLGFWRDPEHVRFYHPDLIELMCRGHGLAPEFHSHRADGREIVPFAYRPPVDEAPLPLVPQPSPPKSSSTALRGALERLLARCGLAPAALLQRQEAVFHAHIAAQQEYTARLYARVTQLEGAVRSLWAVNQTWAWDDNAVIRVRKPG